MKITPELTDEAVLTELGGRLASIRLERNLTQAQLAFEAGVSKRTIERLESGEVGTQLSGFLRVCRALGVIERLESFLPEPAPSPMELLKLGGKRRQRASSPKTHAVGEAPGKWQWGDQA